MKPTKKFLSRLRARIWENGLRQWELSRRSGISEFKISRFLNAHTELSEEETQRLQEAVEKK